MRIVELIALAFLSLLSLACLLGTWMRDDLRDDESYDRMMEQEAPPKETI